jgi:hypothetical protein
MKTKNNVKYPYLAGGASWPCRWRLSPAESWPAAWCSWRGTAPQPRLINPRIPQNMNPAIVLYHLSMSISISTALLSMCSLIALLRPSSSYPFGLVHRRCNGNLFSMRLLATWVQCWMTYKIYPKKSPFRSTQVAKFWTQKDLME